jgi:hypothetical protein
MRVSLNVGMHPSTAFESYLFRKGAISGHAASAPYLCHW